MKLVIFSDKEQYELFLKDGYKVAEYKVFSDNPRFYGYLTSQNVVFVGIDEFLIEPQLQNINSWASTQINAWNEVATQEKLYKEENWISAFRHSLTYALIQIVKNRKMAEALLERFAPHEIIVFKNQATRKYPFFSGNACLNALLAQLAQERKIKIQVLEVFGREVLKDDFPEQLPWFKRALRPLKSIAETLAGLLWACHGHVDFVAFGALKHLGPVVNELKKRGNEVALYDFEYHGEQLLFAIKNRLSYWLPSHFLKGKDLEVQSAWASSQYSEFLGIFEKARTEGLFRFLGYDYGQAMFDNIIGSMGEHFEKLSRERMVYKAIHDSRHYKAWIVDEDYAAKGGFAAAFLNARGVPVYCISHANMTVDFSVTEKHRSFSQSTTFVQSEYEKLMYANRGWDPNRIIVTGSPRYDRISQLPQSNRRAKGKIIKLLHPAGHLWPNSPDVRGYLGCHITNGGDFQVPSLKKIISALSGLPIELIIKPHDIGSVLSYKDFVRKLGPQNRITVAGHSEDFLRLLADCDALVLSCCSTTLIESALCRKSVFLVEGKSIPSPALKKLAQMGLCQIFSDVELLRKAFTQLCDIGSGRYFASIPRVKEEFYLGRRDGQSTGRVVDFMLAETSVSAREHCHV